MRTYTRLGLLAAVVLALGLPGRAWTQGAGPSEAQAGTTHNCPSAGKWSIAVWEGPDGTAASDALAACGAGAVDVAYSLDSQTQVWSRWFADKPQASNLPPLSNMQGVLTLGGTEAAAAGTEPLTAVEAAGQLQNCPAPGKWSIAVWDGDSGTTADEALATCSGGAVAAAYSLDPQTGGWLRWFAASPAASNMPPFSNMQGVLTLAAGVFEEGKVCRGGDPMVALLVDPSLVSGIRSRLDQFEHDLCSEGYAVVERASAFAAPPDIRAYLAQLYAQTTEHLVGAILIGDLPHAYQWVTLTSTNPDIPSISEEAISFQYYADLDGVFEASPGYTSPAGRPYSYDVHRGDVDWEIWIGVLPLYGGDPAVTAEAINRYFAKNHAYRAGVYDLPPAFLEISEHYKADTPEEHTYFLGAMRSGQYAWTPLSDAPDARLYFDSPPGGLSVDQGYADLSEGLADLTVVEAHGAWSATGRLDIAWVESKPVRTAFFWSDGCAVGNLDHAENFLTSVLYSPTSMVVVAKGTTNDSGGLGTNQNGFYGHNIATALAHGDSLGEALLSHVNIPLIEPWSEDREFHFATPVILGDPTLTLLP